MPSLRFEVLSLPASAPEPTFGAPWSSAAARRIFGLNAAPTRPGKI
jgi:hypothetical protein